ncbi:hypothetical protein AGMMS50276_31250 [Synergistales bacterium]|nr:hypothetical protein AGMMS50276_31250 [Synergistales bacterium]
MVNAKNKIFCLLNYESSTNWQIQSLLFPSANYLSELLPFLKKNRLSAFHSNSTELPVVDVYSLPIMHEGYDLNSVGSFDDADGKLCIKIDSAWVVDFNAQKAAQNVYVSIDGQLYNVQRFGETPRPDVVRVFNNPAYLQSGFYREIRTPFDLRDGLIHYISLVVSCEDGMYVSNVTVAADYLSGKLELTDIGTDKVAKIKKRP